MALNSAAIRQSIREVLTGLLGTISPEPGVFEYGAFEGQLDAAKLAKLRQTSTAKHWFDVQLSPARTHPASNVSTLTSRRILAMDVTINVWTGLATEVQEDERATVLADIASDLEDACQSLAYPHNLDASLDATETGIVGGCMSSPDGTGTPNWDRDEESWSKRWIKSVITGSIIIAVASLFLALPLVDRVAAQPAWAICTHTQLAKAQSYAIRIRNESDEILDVGFVSRSTDLDAITAHCGSGDGWLVRVYNGGTAGGYLEQTDSAKQAKICVDGVPTIDGRGHLYAPFDSTAIEYAGSYALSGASDVTLVNDAAPISGTGYFQAGLFGGNNKTWAAFLVFGSYVLVGQDGTGKAIGFLSAPAESWWQFSAASGATPADVLCRKAGVVTAPDLAAGSGALTYSGDTMRWGSTYWGSGHPPVRASLMLFFTDVLGTSDQSAVDAWSNVSYVLSTDAVLFLVDDDLSQLIDDGDNSVLVEA